MSYKWDRFILVVDGKPRAYVLPVHDENGQNTATHYQARLSPPGERGFFATLEEAKTWCVEQLKVAEVERVLDGKRRARDQLHYFPAFLSAASTVASGSSRVNGASSSGTAP
jgi:hypothetical protein